MRGVRWLDAGIIQSILAGIRFRPSFAVNVADPHQDLLPLSSGLLNFVAVDEVDSWRIAIWLSRRSIVTSGLSFAVTDDPTRHEVAVPIQPLAAERLPLSGLRRRYAVRHREGFDRHNPGWLTFARRLRERDLAAALADLTRRFYRTTVSRRPPRRCRRSRRSRSALEPGRAPPAATSTTPRTATRSARWHPAPHSRRCPPAGAARYATARLPTTNRCRAPWHRPRTRPPNAEPHGLLAAA